MPTAPPFSPATVTNTSRGQATWNTVSSPYVASLETPATEPPYDETDYLDFSAYFNSPTFPARVPSGATARITWTVVRSVSGAAGAKDLEVYVLVSGTPTGSNLERSGEGSWPGSDAGITYQADVPADAVNNNTLGLRIAAQIDGSGIAIPSITSANITAFLPLIPLQEGEDVGNTDDGQAADDGTGYDNSGAEMRAGIVPGGFPPPDLPYAAFLRIPNIDIPAGSTIVHAYFHLYDHGGGATDIEVGVKADASAVAPVNATEVWADVNSNLSATQATWSLGSSTPSEPYPIVTSPDCAALIQEFIDLGGYAAGTSDLLAYFYGDGGSTDYHDFGTSDGYEPGFLTVEYTPPGGGDPVTLSTGTVYQMLIAGLI